MGLDSARPTRDARPTRTDGADLPARAPGARRSRAGGARPRAAAGRRPRGRAAAGAGRARHRQDDDPGRGDRRPDRAPRRRPVRGPRADLLAQGRRAAARPGDRARWAARRARRSARLPLLRLRPDPPLRARASSTAHRCGCSRRPSRTSCVRELLQRHAESVVWPPELDRALGTRGFAREVQMVLARAREKGMESDDLRRARASARAVPEYVAAGLFLADYLTNLDDQSATDYADLIRRAVIEADGPPRRAAAAVPPRLRRRVPGHRPRPGRPAARARRRRPRPGRRRRPAPVDLRRSAAPRCAASSSSPPSSRAPTAPPRRSCRCARPAGSARGCWSRRSGSPAASGCRARSTPSAREAFLSPVARGRPTAGLVSVRTFDTERAEAEHLADLLRRAHLEDGVPWDRMAVLVRSGRTSIPPLRRALGAAGVPGRGGARRAAAGAGPGRAAPARRPAGGGQPRQRPTSTPPTTSTHARAEALLLGPLGGLDAGDVRRLSRLLRLREKEAAQRRRPAAADLAASWSAAPCSHDGFLDGLAGPEVDRRPRLCTC